MFDFLKNTLGGIVEVLFTGPYAEMNSVELFFQIPLSIFFTIGVMGLLIEKVIPPSITKAIFGVKFAGEIYENDGLNESAGKILEKPLVEKSGNYSIISKVSMSILLIFSVVIVFFVAWYTLYLFYVSHASNWPFN